MKVVATIENVGPASAHAAALGLDLAVELASSMESEAVQRHICRRAAEATRADRVTLVSLQGGDLVVEDGYDRQGLPLSSGLRSPLHRERAFHLAEETRSPVEAVGPQFDGYPAARLSDGTGHVMVLPLLAAGEVVGFLTLVRGGEPPFNRATAETVRVIGALAALNLRNARLIAEAEAARGSMKSLLSVVVHELRSPLTVASGYVRLMRDGTLAEPPPAWERPLQMVEDKLSECQRLMEELLLAARLEAGAVSNRSAEIDLQTLARRAVHRAEPRALLLNATLTASLPEGAVWAAADATHVDRILNNLIENALRHGGAPAEVTVTAGHDGTPYIDVCDRGPGIPPQNRDSIFDRFVRGHGSDGSGLGLFISRQLAEALGGSLELDPGHSPGARFILRLPEPERRAARNGQAA